MDGGRAGPIGLAFLFGTVGLTLAFGDPGPGETHAARLAGSVLLAMGFGAVVGALRPAWWAPLATLAAWGWLVVGVGALAMAEARLAALGLAPVAASLLGAGVARLARGKHRPPTAGAENSHD